MNKHDYQERIRKIKWQTEKESGRKMGKKALGEAQKIVMEMTKTPTTEPKDSGGSSFKEQSQVSSSMKSLINLNNLIGRDYGKDGKQ